LRALPLFRSGLIKDLDSEVFKTREAAFKRLRDPVTVLTACGDDAEGLRRMCQEFQTYAPARLAGLGDALRDRRRGRRAPGAAVMWRPKPLLTPEMNQVRGVMFFLSRGLVER
jgi:hypothetical protein